MVDWTDKLIEYVHNGLSYDLQSFGLPEIILF